MVGWWFAVVAVVNALQRSFFHGFPDAASEEYIGNVCVWEAIETQKQRKTT